MPFNGAGVFSRTPGTRIANQGPLVSAQVNDETDNLVVGINGKVNLDGLLAMTGLQALFGDGTTLLHGATVSQVQKNLLSHATTVGGTVDAIQATMTPANTTLTNRERIRWTSAGANTGTAPTLSKDGGVTNKTIKKGASAALAIGDLGAAGQVNEAIYNGTDWLLLSAGSGSSLSLASTTEVLTGTDAAKAVTPDALAALWEKGADIASAGTISVGEGGTFDVTGTTSITDIDPATDKAGRTFRLVHEAAHILTHNASTMINLTGANITTAAGDISTWQSEGSDVVRMLDYARASGAGLLTSGITRAAVAAGGSAAAGADETWQVTTSDYTNATSTLSDVMATTGLGAGVWEFEYHLIARNSTAAGGVGYAVNFGGTVTEMVYDYVYPTGNIASNAGNVDGNIVLAGAGFAGAQASRVSGGLVSNDVIDTVNADFRCTLRGTLVVTVSGTLTLQARRDTAGTVTIKDGSNLVLKKIA